MPNGKPSNASRSLLNRRPRGPLQLPEALWWAAPRVGLLAPSPLLLPAGWESHSAGSRTARPVQPGCLRPPPNEPFRLAFWPAAATPHAAIGLLSPFRFAPASSPPDSGQLFRTDTPALTKHGDRWSRRIQANSDCPSRRHCATLCSALLPSACMRYAFRTPSLAAAGKPLVPLIYDPGNRVANCGSHRLWRRPRGGRNVAPHCAGRVSRDAAAAVVLSLPPGRP